MESHTINQSPDSQLASFEKVLTAASKEGNEALQETVHDIRQEMLCTHSPLSLIHEDVTSINFSASGYQFYKAIMPGIPLQEADRKLFTDDGRTVQMPASVRISNWGKDPK